MSRMPDQMAEIQIEDQAIVIDAGVIGKALGIEKHLVQALMRQGKITTVSERGLDEDSGTHRLTFFHDTRRARLIVDDRGHILRSSSIDFGDRASPAMKRSRR